MSRAVVVVAFAVSVVIAVTLWPLLAMTAAFACCGAAHVVVELRYVTVRFRDRLPLRGWLALGALLLAVVLARAAGSAMLVSSSTSAVLELVLAAAALGVGVVVVWRTARRWAGIGIVVAVALVIAAVSSPLHALLLLAVLHNLTPIGFVAERAPPSQRRRTSLVAALVMCGVPAFVASGIPLAALAPHVDVSTSWPSAPALYESYAVWLTPTLSDAPHALALFSAAVSAQWLHYGAVLWWLPREACRAGEELQPATPVLVAAVAMIAALAVAFAVDFQAARVVYGLMAAVHAWIELPVLLVGCAAPASTSGPA